MNKNAHSFRYSSAARGFCSADRVGILKLLHEHNLEGWLVEESTLPPSVFSLKTAWSFMANT